MALNRALFTKQLNLGLNTVFGMEYDRYPEQWREIYSTEQSQKAFEEDVQMIGFGAAPTKAEGTDEASALFILKSSFKISICEKICASEIF